jgi:hypothetical protein
VNNVEPVAGKTNLNWLLDTGLLCSKDYMSKKSGVSAVSGRTLYYMVQLVLFYRYYDGSNVLNVTND